MKNKRKNLMLFLCSLIMGYMLTGCSLNSSDVANNSDLSNNSSEGVTELSKGIEALEKIEIGGIEQWIYMTSNDVSKPILLFIHGGPGYTMLPILHEYNRELEDHFVVVNWDQRGAGLSYSDEIPYESMTLKQFVSDLHELTNYLKTRFNKKKIFIVGHSFGTLVGIKAISEYPEDYWAFASVGQFVNFAENEQLSYDFALKSAQQDNNSKAIKQLTSVGRPNEKGRYNNDSGYEITLKWMEYYGGDIYGETSTEKLEDEILHSHLYKGYRQKVDSGYDFSELLFEDEEVLNINLKEQLKSINVPVYFLQGRHDNDTPSKLIEEYFNILSAPKKELIWFENSAHFPFYEEPDEFSKVLIEKVLPEAQDGIIGKWTGSYTTNQVTNTAELNVASDTNGSYFAEFSFHSTDNTINGKYKMTIYYEPENGSITLSGQEWIERPSQYQMVNLVGSAKNDAIIGSVTLSDNTSVVGEFLLKKAN